MFPLGVTTDLDGLYFIYIYRGDIKMTPNAEYLLDVKISNGFLKCSTF